MDHLNRAELVRRYFVAWETGNRRTLEALLASDFSFSSPRDDHLSLAAYWDTCWANHAAIHGFRLVTILDNATEAFVLYECELTSGERLRNAEYFRFAGNQIRAVEVYFGRSLSV